jgi:glycosyltransferase involved in cell wall biosynthesis
VSKDNIVLYIGGFELPDKNAAAHRVVGIAKGLRKIGYRVIFLNSLKNENTVKSRKQQYFGFDCYEYKRERIQDYLFTAKTVIAMIKRIHPLAIIAYNYPALALQRINRLCKKYGVKCFADTTEWYVAKEENQIYRIIKNFDSKYRMEIVHKKLDGIIAISRYLYNYYNEQISTVLIPPTVDITDVKWEKVSNIKHDNITTFIYAGSPSSTKEELDVIVKNIIVASEENRILFKIVGITKDEFIKMYSWTDVLPDIICFYGRIPHGETIKIVKDADWSIILRRNGKAVQAGFPTKLVESISCGTPVIVNHFSNVIDYLDETNSIILEKENDLQNAIKKACKMEKMNVNNAFDYNRYIGELRKLFVL